MISFGAEAAPTPEKCVFFWSLSLSLTFAPYLLNNLKKMEAFKQFSLNFTQMFLSSSSFHFVSTQLCPDTFE